MRRWLWELLTGQRVPRPVVELWQFEPETDQFDATWRLLSLHGSCDEPGGREYLRVRNLWEWLERPAPIAEFIIRHANQPPA